MPAQKLCLKQICEPMGYSRVVVVAQHHGDDSVAQHIPGRQGRAHGQPLVRVVLLQQPAFEDRCGGKRGSISGVTQ